MAIPDITVLLHVCTELRQLAIDMCPVDLGPIERVGLGFSLGTGSHLPQTELEAVLVRSVDILRLNHHTNIAPGRPCSSTQPTHLAYLTLPLIDLHAPPTGPSYVGRLEIDSAHVGTVQIAMQRYAEQVMRYIAERGSKIKVLALAPYLNPAVQPEKDENGHCWPDYHYLRGRTTDVRGVEQVTALPIAQCALGMLESTIVYDT
jgi:hypothetical protein